MPCILSESLLPQQALSEETEQAALWPAPGTEAAAGMDSEARTFIPSRVASPPPKHRREWQLLWGGDVSARAHTLASRSPRAHHTSRIYVWYVATSRPPRAHHTTVSKDGSAPLGQHKY